MEWLTVITTFLQPIIMKCFERTSTEDPQEFLRSHYNSETQRFDADVVEDAIPSTRRAVHKARKSASREDRKSFPRYSYDDLYEITERALLESMNATAEHVAKVRKEAAGLPDNN